MKSKWSKCIFLASASCFFIPNPISAQEFNVKFVAAGEKIIVAGQEDVKSEDGLLRLTMPEGIKTQADDKNLTGIYYPGNQKEPSIISKCIAPTVPMEISMKVKPSSDEDKDQTLLNLGVAELRFYPIKEELALIVQLNEGYVIAKTTCLKGVISDIKVRIGSNDAQIQVNGTEVKLEYPQGKKILEAKMYPRIGGSTGNARLYHGYVYELELKMNIADAE
jgi:hypothetical protein